MKERTETINITPAPMSIASAVALYKRMTDEGKAGFVECFDPDDQDLLRKALDEVGELLYTPGGLHTINGICIETLTERGKDGYGLYLIKTERRTYSITLNLPLGENFMPRNAYPKVEQRVIVQAESIREEDGIYTGYAEACWLAKDEAHADELEQTDGVYVVPAENQ